MVILGFFARVSSMSSWMVGWSTHCFHSWRNGLEDLSLCILEKAAISMEKGLGYATR